ncbi:hypothetical protein [Marivirga arenosa]|uniref:Uncharacterized protein n=1 Tax=Marivirga arenosa TaxID=3059076 RepID=A0AA52EZY1_9BACT|nr:hypothetical protein [Marivirga sp. BKB1-2]WNB17858.1 hypothetical protein QYS47_28375 [Marivirga sp. BKB1-2]
MINLQIGKPLNIKFPIVYRYMDKQFIDLFFDEGKLRISSFDKFRKYPDEIRGDKSEGGGSITGKSDKEGFTFHLMTRVGKNGYMLSTSLLHSQSIMDEFETDGVFRIKDPINFAAAISNSILGNDQVFVGFCNYQDGRIIEKEIKGLSAKDFTNEEGNFIIGGPGMAKRTNEMIGNGIDLMYLKDNKYQVQSEFRFVWTIRNQFFEMNEFLDIECKEAIQYCERIK